LKIETLLPLNRESRDQDLQSTISVPAYSLWSRLDGGQSEELAQWLGGTWRNPLQRSGYQRCLSVPSDLLMGRQTDHLKSSDPKASALLLAPGSARFRQATPAWTQVDTGSGEDKPGGTRGVAACVPAYVTGARTRGHGCDPYPHGGCWGRRYPYKASQIFVRIHQTPLQSSVRGFTLYRPPYTKEQLDASQGGL
jgi:hypothetical protein